LPGVTLVKMMEQMIDGYEAGLKAPRTAVKTTETDLSPIKKVLQQAKGRRWHHLADERIEDVSPHIPLGTKFWALDEDERTRIKSLFADEKVANKINEFKGYEARSKLKVVDAAYWMKGCSSLGRLRYAVLLGVGKRNKRRYCLIDLKEATKAASPGSGAPGGNDAERVVTGACNLSPNLGQRMLAVKLAGKSIVMRELMPQDLKFDLDILTQDEAVAAAHYLAAVIGKAHGRQMDKTTRIAWLYQLKKWHSKSSEAPNWLWSSVVALIAEHEVAYLEHCRKYATS
jgi:uncharacterized protein (DUF2252 family)